MDGTVVADIDSGEAGADRTSRGSRATDEESRLRAAVSTSVSLTHFDANSRALSRTQFSTSFAKMLRGFWPTAKPHPSYGHRNPMLRT